MSSSPSPCLWVVRDKEREAPQVLGYILQRGGSNGHSVPGAGPPPKLVHDNQAAGGGMGQYGGGLPTAGQRAQGWEFGGWGQVGTGLSI